ncbi:MAG TPA: mannosyltransferase family protein [Streptosporangiaceae bacterium]|jgi:hypothetical protein
MSGQITAPPDGESHAPLPEDPPAAASWLSRSGLARFLSPRLAPEREALGWWLLTRFAALWIAAQAAWLFAQSEAPVAAYLDRWNTWDSALFIQIAQYGYDGPPGDPHPFEAFFPGMPLMLRLVHIIIPNWILAGLVISFVAGGIGVMALARLAADEFGTRVGGRAVLLLCVSPLAVFLSAGYTEALFLGFAMPAWLAARRGRWASAGLLAAGASCTRISGLFLAAALIVEFASTWLPQRFRVRPHPGAATTRIWQAPWLLVPFIPVFLYFAYLKARKGSWTYYFEAQKIGWGRGDIGFVKTFENMWAGAFNAGVSPGWQWSYRFEMIAVAVGVVLVIYLLTQLRYSEAVYVAASLYALATSGMYFSTARATLLWWPLWIGLATVAVRPRYGTIFTRAYLVISVPLAVFLAGAYTTWRWAG